MKNASVKILLLLILGIGLVACGSAGASSPSSEEMTGDAEADTAVTPESAIAAEEPADDRADWPEKFVIGVFAGDDAEAALEGSEPLQEYLEAKLGIPVEAITGTSYSAVIEAMRAGRVDAMEVGPFAFVLAEREAGAIPLATSVNEARDVTEYDADLFPYYYSVFITRKGSGIRTLEDLQGVDFAFVDPASTSGRNAPVVRLINEFDELETPEDVDNWLEPIFAGSHPSAVQALINDKVAAAATYEGNLLNMREEGVAEVCGFEDNRVGVALTQEQLDAVYEACPEGHLVVIAQSEPIPNTPFAISPQLPESFRNAVQEALLATADDPEFIKVFGSWYVDPSELLDIADVNAFYDVVRDIAEITVEE